MAAPSAKKKDKTGKKAAPVSTSGQVKPEQKAEDAGAVKDCQPARKKAAADSGAERAKRARKPAPGGSGKGKKAKPPAASPAAIEREGVGDPSPAGTKRKKPARKAEVIAGTVPEWATSTVIAQLLGKSVRRVQQLTQEGIIETAIPPGGGARRYRTCETIQKYIAAVEEKAALKSSDTKTAELELKKLEAEVALKESQGRLHILKTDIAEGKYIQAAQAQEDLAKFFGVFKKFAAAMPARLAGTMTGYADPVAIRTMEKSMANEIGAMLTAFVTTAELEETETSEGSAQ